MSGSDIVTTSLENFLRLSFVICFSIAILFVMFFFPLTTLAYIPIYIVVYHFLKIHILNFRLGKGVVVNPNKKYG